SSTLRADLVTLALLPRLESNMLASEFRQHRSQVIDEASDLGFIAGDTQSELHPLLREFLLLKLIEEPNWEQRVRNTVRASIEAEEWEHALSLLLRFNIPDLIDPVLTEAFAPLARSGRLGTLSAFSAQVRLAPSFPPATVDLVDAEVALREGHLELAINLADRSHSRLKASHPLRS